MEKQKSLYKEVLFLILGVWVFLVMGIFVWLPNLKATLSSNTLMILQNTILYVYTPAVCACWILGELTSNISQVDKIWSIIPFVFCWYITSYSWHAKSVLMSSLATVWGIRLTYQFARKGGYSWRFWEGEEDYRWVHVRARLSGLANNRILFSLFNLLFICGYQLLLLFLISGFVLIAAMGGGELKLRTSDVIVACFTAFFILLETISDYQMQLFQNEKYRRINNEEALEGSDQHYELGFNTNGLFAYSRHPNFTCEQAIWISFYFFSVDFDPISRNLFNIGGFLNVSIIGSMLLVFLFMKSTDLTEEISTEKYPAYKKYQQNVHRLFDLRVVFRRLALGKAPNRDWIHEM